MAPEKNDGDQKVPDGLRSHPPAQPPQAQSLPSTESTRYDGVILDQKRQDGSYQAARTSSSGVAPAAAAAGPSAASASLEQAPSYEEATRSTGGVPTVDSPFNFPTTAEHPPSYEAHAQAEAGSSSASVASKQRPVAIPQVTPDSSSPFLSAYPPSLLAHGITSQTWHSFLETVSAFLTAKVSDQYIAHAGDAAKSMSGPPKDYGKSLVNHTKSVGKQIARDAKRFNVFGVIGGVIGGSISIPMHMAFGMVHTIFEIPTTAISAVTKTPKTPLERAATYSAVANKDWLNDRGLHAVLLTTKQLAEMVHVPPAQFLDIAASGAKSGGAAAAQLAALDRHIEKLEIGENDIVALNQKTLWLVLVPVVTEELSEQESQSQLSEQQSQQSQQSRQSRQSRYSQGSHKMPKSMR